MGVAGHDVAIIGVIVDDSLSAENIGGIDFLPVEKYWFLCEIVW